MKVSAGQGGVQRSISDGDDLRGVEIIWGGKLPSHGDFMWSNPRSTVRVRFEDWLQMGMLQGRSRFGEGWRDFMNSAAVWNFLVPFSTTSAHWVVAGSLAPSRDRVGRQYPFLVGYVFPREMLLRSSGLVMELPMLLQLTGQQLHTAVRSAWSRNAHDAVWVNVLSQWQQTLSPNWLDPTGPSTDTDSAILKVLGSNGGSAVNETDTRTRPAIRGAAYPWPDIIPSLHSANSPSFWWTHPVGGTELKALASQSPLDGDLLGWLCGRGPQP